VESACFVAHYYACKFGLNRLRIDRRYSTKTAVMDKLVIAIYRLRPIQSFYYAELIERTDCLGRYNNNLALCLITSGRSGAGDSGAVCKLGLTIVRSNLLTTPGMLENWTDGRILCRHSASTSFSLIIRAF